MNRDAPRGGGENPPDFHGEDRAGKNARDAAISQSIFGTNPAASHD